MGLLDRSERTKHCYRKETLMSVGRICTRVVDLADEEETIKTAAQRLQERNVGTLVILDRKNKPVGILTDRDLVVRSMALGQDPRQTIVGEVMTRNPRTIAETAPIEQALGLMRVGRCRRLPVTGPDGTLVGLVSFDDILGLLSEEFSQVGTLVEQEMQSKSEASHRLQAPAGGVQRVPPVSIGQRGLVWTGPSS
jgi:CBS domain-containing protein